MEKCRDVTQGYTTQQECDKWPQQICELEKKKTKKYSPETQVQLMKIIWITKNEKYFHKLYYTVNANKF